MSCVNDPKVETRENSSDKNVTLPNAEKLRKCA